MKLKKMIVCITKGDIRNFLKLQNKINISDIFINDDLRLIGDIISEKSQEVKKQHKVEGFFNEKVTYDFVTEKYKIKIMDFDDKNLSKLINNAKSWAMTCMTDPEKNVLVIYRYSNSDNMENNMEFESIKEIFDYAGANFVNIEEGVSLICNRVRA